MIFSEHECYSKSGISPIRIERFCELGLFFFLYRLWNVTEFDFYALAAIS